MNLRSKKAGEDWDTPHGCSQGQVWDNQFSAIAKSVVVTGTVRGKSIRVVASAA